MKESVKSHIWMSVSSLLLCFFCNYCQLLRDSITTDSRLPVLQRMIVLLINCPFSRQSTVQIGNQLPGLKMKSIIVGGVSGDQVSVQQGFYGCMQVWNEKCSNKLWTSKKIPMWKCWVLFFVHHWTFLFPPSTYLRIKILNSTHFPRCKSGLTGEQRLKKNLADVSFLLWCSLMD